MEKLGAFDQLFYKADQYQVATMIMGGASILAPARKGGRLNARAIAGHLGARLGKIPLMRVKLVQDQLRLGSMHKIQDTNFDIDDHINVISLPKGAGYAELSECLAEQSAIPLDLPNLWRWTVIEGLKGGKLAIFCKVHHALADGVGLMEALSSIYDPEPVRPEKLATASFEAEEEPSNYQLLRAAVAESASRLVVKTPRFIAKNAGPILSSVGSGVRELWEARNDPDSSFAMPEVSPTSLNTSEYSGRRAVAWKTLSLPEIKTLARHFDCKVNDIGLLLYSWAMQHYFAGTGEDIDFDLWCAMPMSTRTSSSGEGGNQVTVARLSLHNTLTDPLERLKAINQDALKLKQTMRPEQPVIDMEELADLVFPTVLDGLLYLSGKFNLLGRLGGRFAVANALFSNVPGPPSQVCVANAVMVESIPMIPAVDVLAVSGGITSVDQAITIGFHCDGGVVENPGLFLEGIDAGMAALTAAMEKPGEYYDL
ncbi:MAG: wax ester/triacylglycerol synthase domain-containing protein [Halieaceae bacterium]